MEKYRTFSDEGTGCQPFVPTYYSQQQLRAAYNSSRILSFLISICTLLLYPLFLVLALFRALLLGLSLILAGPLLLLLLPLRVLPYVHWMAKRALLQVSLRLALFAIGFQWINEERADYRRLQLCPSEPKGGSPWSSFLSLVSRGPLAEEAQRAPSGLSRGPSRAVLCLSNFTCFVEVLYLQMRLCPFFLGLHKDGSLSVLSFWGAIKYSLSFELLPGRGQFPSLSALLVSLEGSRSFIPPLVLFPEGQKSNGSCLLQWDAKSLDAAAFDRLKGRVALLGCMYTNEQGGTQPAARTQRGWRRPTYTAPHTVNSPLRHLLLLLLQPRQHLRCIWVPPEDVLTSQQQQQRQQQQLLQKQQQQLLLPQQSLMLQPEQQGDLACIRTTLLRAIPGLASVKKSGKDLKAFSDYWEKHQQKKGRGTKKA